MPAGSSRSARRCRSPHPPTTSASRSEMILSGCRSGHSRTRLFQSACVFAESLAAYGVRKLCRQMMHEGFPIAHCTVEGPVREMGLAAAIRGRPTRTTINTKAAPGPPDYVNRRFRAPALNRLWESELASPPFGSPTSQLGRGSSTSASSSIPVLGGLSAAGPAGRHMPASCWMHLSRRSTTAGQFIAAAWFISAIADRNIRLSSTLSALLRRRSSPRSVASATAMTTLGPRRLTASTRLRIHRRGRWRSFEAAEYATLDTEFGEASGSTGATIAGCLTHRQHPVRRNGRSVSCCCGRDRYGRMTHVL